MIKSIETPGFDLIIDAQQMLIDRYGGASGIRSREGIDAALSRGEQLLAYSEDSDGDIMEYASAIAYGFAKIHHPFVDGNKRIALAVLIIILELNNCFLDTSEDDAAITVEDMAEGRISEKQFCLWVRENTIEELA